MKLNLKFRLFRIINLGVLGVENFYDKKNIQIYNIFILLLLLNMFFYGFLLYYYGFYLQIFFIILSISVLLLGLILNKYNEVKLSKIIVIQFFILTILINLMIFSFETVFTLYFFLVILFSTLIFNEKESNIKIFFIIQNFLLFFVVLTPLKNYLPDMRLLDVNKISELNFITIIDFLFILSIYIFFHTKYQVYREQRYNALNNRLLVNNLLIRHENIKKKMLVSISSNLLDEYFSSYNSLFEVYLNDLKANNDHNGCQDSYNKLLVVNKKIEQVLNYQFSSNKEEMLGVFTHCDILELTNSILSTKHINANVISKEVINLDISVDLYTYFIFDLLKRLDASKNKIHFSLYKKDNPVLINVNNTKIIDVLGIQVNYRYENRNELFLTLYFFENPSSKAIYKLN